MIHRTKYIILLFSVILIILLYLIYKKKGLNLEGAEDVPLTVGNYTCQYFHKLAVSILKKEDYRRELPDYDFIKYLPSHLPYKYDNIRNEFLKNGIDLNYFETIQTNDVSTWCLKDQKSEKIWTIMKPLIQEIYDDAFSKSGLVKKIEYPVIHFRCADTPFNLHRQYHFQKYEFYKKALNDISKKIKKYDTIIISYCNSHFSNDNDKAKCDIYSESLAKYLVSIGYKSIIKCQSNLDDFATMYYAPAVISSGSSYSFMSGFFGKGLFISSGHQDEGEPEFDGIGDWLYNGYNVMHSEVPDYYDTDSVIKILSN